MSSYTPAPRLFLVSNRLPVSIKRIEPGKFEFAQGSGGLVTGLSGLSETTEFRWYGWPGLEIAEVEVRSLSDQLASGHNAVPVLLEDGLADKYYNGFSNSILWPLLHYQPGEITFSESAWQAYKVTNRVFARTIAKDVQDGDLVWIHDYHLMLLPAMLREELGPNINVKIGFFLHCPFPSSEIYRILPVRNDILLGLLQSNLIGFHTKDYARHFISSCSIVLGLQTTVRSVTFKDKTVNVGIFPIGIQPEKFTKTLEEPKVQDRIAVLEHEFRGRQIMVGVDRLDYIKGIPQKLQAFEMFLSNHPECVGSVILVQVAVPTRGEVEEYRNLRALVNELVSRINGKFGTIEYTPIHFMHKSVDFKELLALYAISDACVIASTRDGMNLVSFEYIACQEKRHGSMIISEFVGSAQHLNGSIVVNPWNIFEMARAMYQSITMAKEERTARFKTMNKYVQTNTSAFWGKSFVTELAKAEEPTKYQQPIFSVDWKGCDGQIDIVTAGS